MKKGRLLGGLAARAGFFGLAPPAATVAGIGEASIRTGGAMRRGIRNAADKRLASRHERFGGLDIDDRSLGTSALRFASRRPGVTALGVGAMASSAIYSGGPGSGSRISKRNQNNYYVRKMRSGQSSGVAGIDPSSLGGFA